MRINVMFFNSENDVAAIDVNMGCPKEYSTKVRTACSIYCCGLIYHYMVLIFFDAKQLVLPVR